MSSFVKIVLDTKGADKGPAELIRGGAAALAKYPNLILVLVGDEPFMREECTSLGMPMDRVELIHAPDGITNYDNPMEAVFTKPESSMIKTVTALADREDLFGMISAGNTGALLASALRHLSGKDRVRPAMAAVLPAADGSFTCLLDTGATVDCDARTLLHFAHLGTAFMRDMYGVSSPRVGLLSNGAEPTKGNRVVKEAHLLLKEAEGIHFIGNVEGNRALSGDCDVLVCDGFAGNQVLKVTEGTATRIITDAVRYSKKTGNASIMELVGHLMGIYDISALGGGIILGCAKPVIKARGSATDKTVVSTVGMLMNMAENRALFDPTKNTI